MIEMIHLINDLLKEHVERIIKIESEILQSTGLFDQLNHKLKVLEKDSTYKEDFLAINQNVSEIDEVRKIVSFQQKAMNHLSDEIVFLLRSKDRIMEIQKYISTHEDQRLESGLSILNDNELDRQRIARDLHDSSVQNLTSVIHKLEFAIRLMDIDPIKAKLELLAMSNTVRNVINEMRDIIFNLRPMSLTDLGFIETVERYIRHLQVIYDIKISLNHNRENKGIVPIVNLSLYRIIQEACSNVIKHANATVIDITINYTKENIIVTIKDNGKGFDVNEKKEENSKSNSGYGLSIMKERVYLLSATMEIHSEINKGTSIKICVPLLNCKGE